MMRHSLFITILLSAMGVEKIEPPPQVVRVWCMGTDGYASYGTGALIGETLVITNNHVVRDRESNDSIKVIFRDWMVYDAKIIKTDKNVDLAALRLDSKAHVKPLEIGEMPKIGDEIKFFGYGSGLPDWVSGKVLSLGTQTIAGHEKGDLMEVDVPAHPGDSGAPFLNDKGQYVGTLFGSNGEDTVGPHIGTVLKFLGWGKVSLY